MFYNFSIYVLWREKLKKFLICFLSVVGVSSLVMGARTTQRSVSSTRGTRTTSSSNVSYPAPTQDECNVDIDYCFNRYCFDKKTLNEGVYSKCGAEPASKILLNVEDCLQTRAVIKQLDLKDGCKSYSYDRVVSLLENKDVIETGLKRNSEECQKATKALQAAKNCYALMISSDGVSSLDLYNKLDELCGFNVSGDSYMLNRFFEAGDYGESNIGALNDLKATNQNTKKRENWRQIVDATLAGYTEIAELACGAEDYQITKVNQYALDSHENSQMVMLKAQASEIGKQTANRIVNSWFRQTDCVNSPLPVGGLYWEYKEGGNPDCKLVCKEGYTIGKNSSECVEKENEFLSSSSAFLGLNIAVGNNVVATQPTTTTNTAVTYTNTTPSVSSGANTTTAVNTAPVNFVCSKNLKRKLWSPSKKGEGVCEVFYPNCKQAYYYRNTDLGVGDDKEFFCIGNSKGNYQTWYNMTLADLNSIFGTSYNQMGDNYASNMSKHIKEYCEDYCSSGKQTSSKVEVNTTSVKSNCEEVSKLSVISTGPENLKKWENFMNSYNGNCDEKTKFFESLSELTEVLEAPYLSERYTITHAYNSLTSIMKQAQECICEEEKSVSHDYNYEELVEKKCNASLKYAAYTKDLKIQHCINITPKYCPKSLSYENIEKCLSVLFDKPNMFMWCTYSSYFGNKCLWSRNYDTVQFGGTSGNDYKGAYVDLWNYRRYFNDAYETLPFEDWGAKFPK